MNYADITYPDVNNGLGFRVTLWTCGCPINCNGCHNPELQNPQYGKLFDEEAKNKLFEALSKPYIKGLTLSGGEPSIHEKELIPLLQEIKEKFPTKDIWLFTGYWDIKTKCKELYKYIDYIVEGEFNLLKRDVSLAFRGSSNQAIYSKKEGYIHEKLDSKYV